MIGIDLCVFIVTVTVFSLILFYLPRTYDIESMIGSLEEL